MDNTHLVNNINCIEYIPYADIELIITSSYHRIIVKTQADLGLFRLLLLAHLGKSLKLL